MKFNCLLKKLLYRLPLLLLLVSGVNHGNEKSEYIISYAEHEGLVKYYVPLLKQAYRKIGIEPTFSLINDQRALRLLNNGVIDADTAKSLETINNYKSVLYLPTPISRIEVFFICQKNLRCDRSILGHKELSLAIIGANEFYADLLKGSKISLVELTSFEVLMKMFQQQKVDSAIVVFDGYTKPRLKQFENHYKIQEKLGYHLINKKHKAIIVPLEKAIAEVLADNNFAQP